MNTVKAYKEVPVGTENFKELRAYNGYYVDKTSFIKTVFTDLSPVLLFTRPRRFGKTLLISTIATFLNINKDDPQNTEATHKLFEGTEIIKDKAFCERFLGRFPVIDISLKSIDGSSFEIAYRVLVDLLVATANRYTYLLDSASLSSFDKRDFQHYLDKEYLYDHENDVVGFLDTLSRLLNKHFGSKVVILIDEYDVPLAKASNNGYHAQMAKLIGSFFNVLKNSNAVDKPICKIIMTGCLKVAKNSIFTGVNNLLVNTVLDAVPKYSSLVGFNRNEVHEILKYYDLADYSQLVKDHYDGYRFYQDEIFCPWDVMNFVAKNYHHIHIKNGTVGDIKAENFWINSSQATAIKGYVGYLSENVNSQLQDLVDGKNVEVPINDSMNYDDLNMHRSEDFYSLLLHAGYLTAVTNTHANFYEVRIPNKEILDCFRRNIKEYFDDSLILGKENNAQKIAQALADGDAHTAQNLLSRYLKSFVSLRDFATRSKQENFYHVFLNGILFCSGNNISEYRSNAEAGEGYADIIFSGNDGSSGVIIEIKSGAKERSKELLQAAFEQIESKKYTSVFEDDAFINEIHAYAMVFSGKQCIVRCKNELGS